MRSRLGFLVVVVFLAVESELVWSKEVVLDFCGLCLFLTDELVQWERSSKTSVVIKEAMFSLYIFDCSLMILTPPIHSKNTECFLVQSSTCLMDRA